ncbi:MAG: hypothetical protein SNH28_08990 [Rikenellaceae bacterium]
MDYSSLFSLVLPSGLLDYFKIKDCKVELKRVDLYLDEVIYEPEGYSAGEVSIHGFSRESVIQDFTFRDKSLYLHMRRRRFLVAKTGKTISRDLSFIAQGTHLTAEFAAFLKGVYR